jgi:hypothetical protein
LLIENFTQFKHARTNRTQRRLPSGRLANSNHSTKDRFAEMKKRAPLEIYRERTPWVR